MRFLLFFKSLFIYVLVCISLVILFYNADKKFIGHHDWNGVVYSNIARNYNRYGFLKTKFGQVRNYDYVNNLNFSYFTHYPPLLPIFIALSFRIFGESEISARLVPISSSVLMLFFLYLIAKKLVNENVGLITVMITSILPIYVYFAKLPIHETVLPAFVLGAFYFYIRWFYSRRNKDFFIMSVFVIISLLISWPGYYIVPPLILHTVVFQRDSQNKRKILFLFFLSFILFLLHLFHLKILTGSFFGGGLLDVFIFRSNPYASATIYSFTLRKFLLTEARYLVIYFTKLLIVFSLLFVLRLLVKIAYKRFTAEDGFFIVLLIFGVTHLILFSNMAFIHDYMIYYLLPFVVLSGASFIYYLLNKISSVYIKVIFLLAVLIFIGTERLSFARELLRTNQNNRGYLLGKFINLNSSSGDKTFIGSNSYKEFQEVFIGYYADREVNYGESEISQPSIYKLIIRPKDHDALTQEEKKFLDTHFNKFEDNKYIWYTARN